MSVSVDMAQAIFKSIYMQQSIFLLQIGDPCPQAKPKAKAQKNNNNKQGGEGSGCGWGVRG